jgi:hypothetical protein
MPRYYEFIEKPLVTINWDEYEQILIDRGIENRDDIYMEYNKLELAIERLLGPEAYRLRAGREIVPIRGNTKNDYIEGIRKVVYYFDNRGIPWIEGTVVFMVDEQPGFLTIKDENIVFGYIDEDLELTKEYYPLYTDEKL